MDDFFTLFHLSSIILGAFGDYSYFRIGYLVGCYYYDALILFCEEFSSDCFNPTTYLNLA
jgi:hypothetical protein